MRPTIVVAAIGVLASAQWGTVSLVEIIWTLTGLFGAYFTWSNLNDSKKYVKAVSAMNGERLVLARELRIIAFGHYRNELLRLAMFAIIITIGIAAMLTPPAVAHQPVTPVAIAITMGLLGITALLVIASFLDRRQRDLMKDSVS